MQILLSASEVFACSILYGKGDENYETVKKVIVDYDVCWYSGLQLLHVKEIQMIMEQGRRMW